MWMLNQESSYLTTFNSLFGRFWFLWMLFGLKMQLLQNMFQAKIDQTFEGCEGEVGITDDLVVYGLTKKERDRHMNDNAKKMQNHWS